MGKQVLGFAEGDADALDALVEIWLLGALRGFVKFRLGTRFGPTIAVRYFGPGKRSQAFLVCFLAAHTHKLEHVYTQKTKEGT